MHLLADEGVHQGVVTALRRAEYSVIYVAETMPGATDHKILSKAAELEAVLITSDKDCFTVVDRNGFRFRHDPY